MNIETNSIVLMINFASTLYMVGLIWFVQLVHYPLLKGVGNEGFADYLNRHQRWTTFAVGPPMIAEAFSTMLLVWYPPPVNTALILLGAGLLLIIWVSTALLQVPCHAKLERGFDEPTHRQLVLTNWIRTLCWSLRGLLVCWFALSAMTRAQF